MGCGGGAGAVAGGAKGGVIPNFKRLLKVGGFPTLRGYRRPLLGLRAIFSQRSLLVAQLICGAAFAPFANVHTLGGTPPPQGPPPHPRPRGAKGQKAQGAKGTKGPRGPSGRPLGPGSPSGPLGRAPSAPLGPVGPLE